MLEQLENDVIKIKDWCKNHKKISIAIVIVLALFIGSAFIFEAMFDGGDDKFNHARYNQSYSTEKFGNRNNFSGDGFDGGDHKASFNPQLAITNLLIVTGFAVIVGVGAFIFIYSNKKKATPLPVLYNPIKDSDQEVKS